jgi:hypothetical protein
MNNEKPTPEPNKRRWPFGYGDENIRREPSWTAQ